MEHASFEAEWKVAARAARAAGEVALRHFGRVDAERKGDGSPVTIADRAAEAAAIELVSKAFPDDAILAEESGATGSSRRRWVIDPLDGTRAFVRGWLSWGPLVGFEIDGRPVAGAMYLPVLDQLFDGTRAAISRVTHVEDAMVALGALPASMRGVEELCDRAWTVRAPGDCWGAALLLEGKADLWIESGLKRWDLSALQALVERAGGAFTAFDGGDALEQGCVVAGNPELHARALALIRR